MMIHELYQSRENRDNRAKELRLRYGKANVSVGVSRGQQIHPMYVNDYGRELSESEKGFGNTIYKTYFSRLYVVEVR